MKPSNVMLTEKGRVVLVDFGIARLFKAARKGTMIGTLGFAPPEQYQGIADPRSDIYSLGATLHYILTGRDPEKFPPFSFPPVRELRPEISQQPGRRDRPCAGLRNGRPPGRRCRNSATCCSTGAASPLPAVSTVNSRERNRRPWRAFRFHAGEVAPRRPRSRLRRRPRQSWKRRASSGMVVFMALMTGIRFRRDLHLLESRHCRSQLGLTENDQ